MTPRAHTVTPPHVADTPTVSHLTALDFVSRNKVCREQRNGSPRPNSATPRRQPAPRDIDYLWQTVTFEAIKDPGTETGQTCLLLRVWGRRSLSSWAVPAITYLWRAGRIR